MAVPLGKRLRRSTRSAVIRAAVRLASHLSLGAALRLGGALGRLAWTFAGRTRRLALGHLALAFPEMAEPERRRTARASFLHLARAAMEAVAIGRIDPRLEEYVRFAGESERLLREARGAGRGFVLVTGHLGSWELLARRIARAVGPSVVIARRSWDRKIDDMVAAFRASGEVATLFREDASTGRSLLRAFRQGVPLGVLIDQDTDVEGVFVPFFGRPAFTPRGAADLALRFGSPVFVAWSHRRAPPEEGYWLEVEPVAYHPEPADREAEVVRLTARCTEVLEAAIRRRPEEWVWMHQRWKRQPPGPGSGGAGASSVPKSRDLSRA